MAVSMQNLQCQTFMAHRGYCYAYVRHKMSKKENSHISTFGSRATSVVSLALTLVIFGLVSLTVLSAHNAANRVRTNLTVLVRMTPDATAAQTNALKKSFAGAPWLQRHVYTSAESVLAQESQLMGQDVAALLDENPYSAEFELYLRAPWANPDSINLLTRRLAAAPGVEGVSSDTAVLQSATLVLDKVTLVMLCVAGALLLISFVLINNTVSLSIYSRRFTIHTMKLVGATPWFIRRPFIGAGVVNGLIAGLIAAAALAGIQYWVSGYDAEIGSTLPWQQTAWVYAALPVAGIILCALAAWLASTLYLRRSYDRLFRK